MSAAAKRPKTSHEEALQGPAAMTSPMTSAHIAVFPATEKDPTYFQFTQKCTTFAAGDPECPFGEAWHASLMKELEGSSSTEPTPMELKFVEEMDGRHRLEIQRGADYLQILIDGDNRTIQAEHGGVLLRNGDLVQVYSDGRYVTMDEDFSVLLPRKGPFEFQYFQGEQNEPDEKKINWAHLPPELLEIVFKSVPTCDLINNVAATCQKFRHIVLSGYLDVSTLELATWPSTAEFCRLSQVYGEKKLRAVTKVVIRNAKVQEPVGKPLLRLLGAMESLELHYPSGIDKESCHLWTGRYITLHGRKGQLQSMRMWGIAGEPISTRQPEWRQMPVLPRSVKVFEVISPSLANPPRWLAALIMQALSSVEPGDELSCSLTFCPGPVPVAKWSYGRPRFIADSVGRINPTCLFKGKYVEGMDVSMRSMMLPLSLISLTGFPARAVRSVLSSFWTPFTSLVEYIQIQVENDGHFDPEELTGWISASSGRCTEILGMLQLIVPSITPNFIPTLLSMCPALEIFHLRTTAMTVPVSFLGSLELGMPGALRYLKREYRMSPETDGDNWTAAVTVHPDFLGQEAIFEEEIEARFGAHHI